MAYTDELSARVGFVDVEWDTVPTDPGVYVIYDLRNRLRDHRSGQMVNMFAQYLFLGRVQFLPEERVTHPREAKALLKKYREERCSYRYRVAHSADEARRWEAELRAILQPTLNPWRRRRTRSGAWRGLLVRLVRLEGREEWLRGKE